MGAFFKRRWAPQLWRLTFKGDFPFTRGSLWQNMAQNCPWKRSNNHFEEYQGVPGYLLRLSTVIGKDVAQWWNHQCLHFIDGKLIRHHCLTNIPLAGHLAEMEEQASWQSNTENGTSIYTFFLAGLMLTRNKAIRRTKGIAEKIWRPQLLAKNYISGTLEQWPLDCRDPCTSREDDLNLRQPLDSYGEARTWHHSGGMSWIL